MSTVAYIHSYPGATETLKLLWPGFKLLGWPLIGVETVDGEHEWPEPVKTITIGINKPWHMDKRSLPTRLINTLGHFLAGDHKRCCILEYDTLILGPLMFDGKGLVTHLAGGQLPEAECRQFFHTPWVFERPTAAKVIVKGTELIYNGTCDRGPHGSPDVFMGLVIEQLGLPWEESGTFSANTIEGPFVEPARAAYRAGCKLFHGVKTREQMESITCATIAS